MHYYTTFGIHIGSELELPELGRPGKKTIPDLTIRFQQIPEQITDALYKGRKIQIGSTEVLIRIDHVAGYLIREGKEICITPDTKAEPALIRVFLLGPVIGIALHQRGFLVLHGSSVEWNNHAVIFAGASGSGKSSVAAALVQKGFLFLADDLCPLQIEKTSKPVLLPSIPQLKLMEDTLLDIDFSPASIARLASYIPKFGVSVSNHATRNPSPVNLIFILMPETNKERISIEEVSGFSKFTLLRDNTYRFPYLRYMNLATRHFDQISSLANQVKVFRLERSFNMPIETTADAIVNFLAGIDYKK